MTPLIRASLIASLLLAQSAFAQTPTAAAPDAPAAAGEVSPAPQETPGADAPESGADAATPAPDAAAPASAAPLLPQGAPARVEQPRAFGHTLGDLLTQQQDKTQKPSYSFFSGVPGVDDATHLGPNHTS